MAQNSIIHVRQLIRLDEKSPDALDLPANVVHNIITLPLPLTIGKMAWMQGDFRITNFAPQFISQLRGGNRYINGQRRLARHRERS
jgi:hypothetical protein